MARLEAEAVELRAHDANGVNSLLRTEECTRAILAMRRRSGLGTAADLRALMRRETGLDPLESRRRFDRRQAELQASSSAEPHGKPRPLTCLGTSGSRPGRGVDSPHPAVRAPSGPLRDEQLPVDRHLMPRDAAERRLVRQGVLQRPVARGEEGSRADLLGTAAPENAGRGERGKRFSGLRPAMVILVITAGGGAELRRSTSACALRSHDGVRAGGGGHAAGSWTV
ncbi:Scr1 family TA system antitoxin-like transcriptional regulator [Streptomyces prasinus]